VRGGAAEVQGLAVARPGLTYGGAGFYAGGAEQARNLLEMKLHGVGAKDFCLGEVCTGVADLRHAFFEAGDVAFEVEVGRRNVEAPTVNALRDVLKSCLDVCDEAA